MRSVRRAFGSLARRMERGHSFGWRRTTGFIGKTPVRRVGWTVGDKQSTQKYPHEQCGIPLDHKEVNRLLETIPGWEVDTSVSRIRKTYVFKDSSSVMSFLPLVTNIATNTNHNPEEITARPTSTPPTVSLVMHTNKLGGLSYSDFLVAFKIDSNLEPYKTSTSTSSEA
ncbi:hypothetical protein AAMO2058_001503400 [Amorphochlora amoebiformis]